MTAFRRLVWNFSLQRAVELAKQWSKPLLVLEALRCDYAWASERFHRFVMQGMSDNAQRARALPIYHYAYVEPAPGAGKGLLEALAGQACAVVTDEFPCFFLPRMTAAAARTLPVLLERVDGNGLLPLRAASIAYPSAYAFRRLLHHQLPEHLLEAPLACPLQGHQLPLLASFPREVVRRWPPVTAARLEGNLDDLPIDHSVKPAAAVGGTSAGGRALRAFLEEHLPPYAQARNEPDLEATSHLSPYLHFGHLSAHQVFHELAHSESWSPERLAARATGQRAGWWGMSESAEAFLDQLITWRELGFNFAYHRPDYDGYESLPNWAKATLAAHAADPRPYFHRLEDLEAGHTHDALWNAAQRQLRQEGVIHGYLRMLWGKKILEWSPTPARALETMIHLNNKYALDGRDPNSYSGIFWCLGRYDRPWPERAIYGKVRTMSSKNTARKVSVKGYLARYESRRNS